MSSCSSSFHESVPDSGLNFATFVRPVPVFPIAYLRAASHRLRILRVPLSARSFPGATLGRPVPCIGAGQSCGIATEWNGEPRTRQRQSLVRPTNPPVGIRFDSALRSRRTVRAGCSRSIGRLKYLGAQCLYAAIISGAFSRFEKRAGMRSFHLRKSRETI